MKKLLFFIVLTAMGMFKGHSQTLVQTYVDRCTGQVSVFSVPMNGSTVVAFYNRSRTFTSQDFQNGILQSWLEETYLWWTSLSPCSTTTTGAQATQQTTQQTTQQATQAATNAAQTAAANTTTNVPSTPVSPPPPSQTSQPTTTAPNTSSTNSTAQNTTTSGGDTTSQGNNTSSTGGSTSSQGDSQSNTNSDNTTSGGETTSSSSSDDTTTSGSDDTSGGTSGNEDATTTDETTTEEPTTEETTTEEKTEEVKEETKEETKEESKEEQSEEESETEETDEESDESKEEDSEEESDEEESESDEDEESEEEDSEEESNDEDEEEDNKKKKKKRNLAPPIVTANAMAQQLPTGEYQQAITLGISRSSLMGTETYGVNVMVFDNLQQFMLNVNYSKVHINKQGRINRVYSASVGGMKMFTTYMGMMNHSFTFLGKKGSVAGIAFGTSATMLDLNYIDGNVYVDTSLLGLSLTGFYTKSFEVSPKLSISPMLAVSSPFLQYEMFDREAIWNENLMFIAGTSFTYKLTQRFGLNLGVNIIESTLLDFPTMKTFTIGGRLSF
jgi:hypothetical protein